MRQWTVLFAGCGVSMADGNVNHCSPSSSTARSVYASVGGRRDNSGVADHPVESPIERSDDAVFGNGGEVAFPGVEDRLKHQRPMLYSSVVGSEVPAHH